MKTDNPMVSVMYLFTCKPYIGLIRWGKDFTFYLFDYEYNKEQNESIEVFVQYYFSEKIYKAT
jgi:hypothetical protein